MAPTPGVVLLAAPGDWDSRVLYRTLREVAQLPVRGFVRDVLPSFEDGRLRSYEGGWAEFARVREARREAERGFGGPVEIAREGAVYAIGV